MVDAHSRFLRQILEDSHVPEDAAESIVRELAAESEAAEQRRALERGIGSSKSYAYLWSDLLRLESALEVLGASLKGEAQIAGIKALLKFWITLRDVRVELDEDQANVLRAVRRKGESGASRRDLAEALPDFDESKLQTLVADLKKKTYKGEIPMLEERGGRYVTRF